MTPGEILVPWVLLLEQESYLSYTKKVIKEILQTTDSYITILKNRLLKHQIHKKTSEKPVDCN